MLKIMTLNINYDTGKHGPWHVRRELIQSVIEEHSPDAIALQAVRRNPEAKSPADQATQLAGLLPEYRYVVFEPAIERPGGIADGSTLLSRLEIYAIDHIALTLLPGLEDDNPRILMHAAIEVSGQPFHLFNAHFSWVEQQAALNIAEALLYLNSFVGPKVLTGDFNTQPNSPLLKRFIDDGWVDVWSHLRPEEPGYTFESDHPGMRIDYAWVKEIPDEMLKEIHLVEGENAPAAARLSDHLGLLVVLAL
ncbi:MAG: hypothetical protein EHM70_01125 [Chloroflexota bacterium]|nr:MAG: hypothetical protein EHM70_01125 [Chloroflexota bacterium]